MRSSTTPRTASARRWSGTSRSRASPPRCRSVSTSRRARDLLFVFYRDAVPIARADVMQMSAAKPYVNIEDENRSSVARRSVARHRRTLARAGALHLLRERAGQQRRHLPPPHAAAVAVFNSRSDRAALTPTLSRKRERGRGCYIMPMPPMPPIPPMPPPPPRRAPGPPPSAARRSAPRSSPAAPRPTPRSAAPSARPSSDR